MFAKYKELGIVLFILALAAVLRFWGLAAQELHSDGAHYAFRAFGWFDYLGGDGQTTPIQWFGAIPAWANLSFHDAPPLAFALQKFAFWVLGGSVFAALLPAALAGLGTTLLLYFAAKAAFGISWARLAAGLYAISSYAIWSGRAGYLEAVEVLFLVGSFYFFYRYWQTAQSKFVYWWGLFTGLALLTKYTALFLLPAVLVFILWNMRARVMRYDFWLAVLLALAVLSPVIIYNIEVFLTRGHFDAALSSIMGMKPEDFKLIAGRVGDTRWWQSASGVVRVLSSNISQPIFWLYIIGVLWLLLAVVLRRASEFSEFLLLHIVFAWIMFGFTGSTERYLSVLMPFLVLSLVSAIFAFWQVLPAIFWRRALVAVVALAVMVELGYCVQTNLLNRPLLAWPGSYAGARFYNRGFAELEKFLVGELKISQQSFQRPQTIQALSQLTVRDSKIIFFDTRADWFSSMWHVSRLRFYYNAPIVGFKESWTTDNGRVVDTYEQFKLTGLPYMLLVVAVGDNLAYSGGKGYDKAIGELLTRISAADLGPIQTILDYQGKPGFEIYRLTPTSLASL